MFISKNLAKTLRVITNSTLDLDEDAIKAVESGLIPNWIGNIKGEYKKFGKFLFISEPVNKAVSQFRPKLVDNGLIIDEWSDKTPSIKRSILVKKNIFFIEKKGSTIYFALFLEDGSGFDLANVTLSPGGSYDFAYVSTTPGHKDFSESFEDISVSTLLPILIFLDTVEMQEKVVKANTKQRGISKKSGHTNLSEFDVAIITSAYFTKIYVEGGFEVSGHWRMQPCGPGMQDRKLIYINPFVKDGYTRRAQIEINRDNG